MRAIDASKKQALEGVSKRPQAIDIHTKFMTAWRRIRGLRPSSPITTPGATRHPGRESQDDPDWKKSRIKRTAVRSRPTMRRPQLRLPPAIPRDPADNLRPKA